MADFVYNTAMTEIAQGGTFPINLLTDTVKMGLASTTYTADRDNDLADAAGANDFIDGELSGTGYVAGYGNSGRKTLASKTLAVDKANDRADFDAADVTWTGIDAGTASQAVLLIEDHEGAAADDTDTRLVTHHDTNFPVTTNGGDLTVQSPNDIIRFSTV